MKRNLKKIFCVILGVLMIISMTGWTTGDIWSPEAYPKADENQPFPTSPIKSDYSKQDYKISENDKYELWWIASNCSVDLIEKGTENRWGVTARKKGELTVDPNTNMPISKNPQISSAVVIEVLNLSTYQTEEYFSAVSAVKNGFVITEDIDNGVKIEYYFDDVQIMIPIEFTLREDSVSVTVKPTEILEGEDFRVVSISLASFWCSTPNDEEDAYLFYPSGSGALVSNESVSQAGIKYSNAVYGFDASMTRENRETIEREIRMPVYGAKYKDTATCAIIEQNAESAYIGVKVGSTTLGHSGIFTTYQVRGFSDNYAQSLNNGKSLMQIYAISLCDKPMTVGFYPLTNEDANYSGMAKTYKNFLKKQGSLTETVSEESPLNVTFVGGVMIDKSFLGIPYTDLVAATTLTDAKEILAELSAETKTKISAKLLGFGATGLEYSSYAGGFKINKNLGNLKDLDALSNFSKENNIDLYFEVDLIKLKKSSAGFSVFFDTAYNPILKIATAYKYHAATGSGITSLSYNLLSRPLIIEGAEKFVKKTAKWNLPGVSIGDLSNTAYSDSSTQNTDYFVKGKMAEDVTKVAEILSDSRKISSTEANIYAALVSDVVYDAPTESSNERIFICDVPFYEMVIKGYVPFSAGSMNLATNANTHLLKTVESGAGLNYTLIDTYYNEFIDYEGYYFYGSLYSDLADGIKATYNSLKDYYQAIEGQEIVSHTILDSGLRETVFSNGVKAYVNYTDKSIDAPSGAAVEAGGYVWEKN